MISSPNGNSDTISVVDWGTIPYRTAWEQQRELHAAVLAGNTPSTLVLCEHPPVITVGRVGSEANVLLPVELLAAQGVEVVEVNRGGDVTLHNPGQLVAYPVFNLRTMKEDLHWFLRCLEQAVIDTLLPLGLTAERVPGLTGVWIEQTRKICAMGLHCSRWVTYHGLALNVCNDVSQFSWIVPCGITDKAVTSVALETNTNPDMTLLKELLSNQIVKNVQKR